MSAISINQGAKLFLQALKISRWGNLNEAAEYMYKLNVFARSIGRHPIVDEIYHLKNELIKYLYQCGYSTEVKLHFQKRMCLRCDGTGEYWTGAECYRCNGTGIYAITRLYAFRFCIDGKTYAWHQLEKLIDYPVILTADEGAPFPEELRKDAAILSLGEAWMGCCVVWWSLFFHGVWTNSLLFDAIKAYFYNRLGLYKIYRVWGQFKGSLRLDRYIYINTDQDLDDDEESF